MDANLIGWQLDIFGGESAVVAPTKNPDPLPDPHTWNEDVREKMVDALIGLACDSRRGDNMPESLLDCAEMLRARMTNRAVGHEDYAMTLGWIFEMWDGALPYRYVCAVNAIDPETMQDVILNNPRLARDLDEVRLLSRGTLV